MEIPLSAADVQKFDDELETEQLNEMIETVWADVLLIAPCVKEDDFGVDNPEYIVAVKSVMRDVILRWADVGSGAVKQRGAGDFSETLNVTGGGRFRPNEIRRLQDLCTEVRRRARASTITVGLGFPTTMPTVHPFVTDNEGLYW